VARKTDKILDKIVQALKKEFKPSRMFLFGSRANGTYRPDSDYDFVLVVKKMRGTRIGNMVRAEEALEHLSISSDVFVYDEKEFNEWKDELSSIPETALNTGKEIDLG
jgi:predicted nucleotidyltransferase